MVAGPDVAAEQTIEALQRELAAAMAERDEARAREAALAQVLRAINASRGDLKPVFDLINERAMTMCDADGADLLAITDGFATSLAMRNPTPAQVEFWRKPFDLSQGAIQLQNDPRTIHHVDMAETEVYKARKPLAVMAVEGAGMRTLVQVPLTGEGGLIGQFALYRRAVRPFSDKQIALIEAFAAQAALAIENARLVTEQREALEQQTATAEVLRVISQSPTDVQPVLEVVVKAAQQLCGAEDVVISLREGDELTTAAHGGPFQRPPPRRSLDRDSAQTRAIIDGATVHLPDTQQLDPADWSTAIALSRRHGIRAILAAPMLREGAAIGTIMLRKREPVPFSPQQVGLLETFAAQAVIAIENVRLFTEQRELLEQQTATAEILRVISQSPTDVEPVMAAVARAAVRFCGAEDAHVFLRDGDEVVSSAHEGPLSAHPLGYRDALDVSTARAHSIVDARVTHVADTEALGPDEYPVTRVNAVAHGFRAQLNAPMLRDGHAIGCICLRRREPGAFTPRQIQLVETFAAQAVIAIENVRLFTELREALEQQTATADILRVISQSPTDVQPVLGAVTSAALRFCGANDVQIALREGNDWFVAAHQGPIDSLLGVRRALTRDTAPGRAVADSKTVHFPDVEALDPVEFAEARRLGARLGFKSALCVPMLRDGVAIGAISLRRPATGAFSDRQISMAESFAAQAVIAIENVRLFTELKESLHYQTATSQLLEVISLSAADVQPVLDTMLASAGRLCGVQSGGVAVRRGDALHYVATLGQSPEFDKWLRETPHPIGRSSAAGRATLEKDIVHIADVTADPEYAMLQTAAVGKIHTLLSVPLLREGEAVGAISLTRTEVEPFTERQIALVRTFADQAVIAMENARLLGELTRREEELRVTFDHMGDGVVMFDAALRLASWNRNFQELLDIPDSFLAGRPGLEDYVRLLVGRGEVGGGNPDEEIAGFRQRANQQWSTERTRPDGRVIEVRNNPVPGGGAVLIYSDITERKKAEAEIRAARDAAEAALERQTATADILKVIASSPTDVEPVLKAVVGAARRFCGADDAMIVLREETDQLLATHEGALQSLVGSRFPLDRSSATGRATIDGQTFHVPDVALLDPADHAMTIELTRRTGVRALLAAPLLREGQAIGCVLLRKPMPGAFTPHQIELLETFAAQAVIAIENVRLFTELRDSLERLKAAQANLIQSEKMASLGQLTAGIAHEIKNPLNFVNNFASLSVELLDELREVAGPALATLDKDKRAELDETMSLLVGNLGKITEHGKRADGIVKSMLSHSRGGAGDWQASDINALVEEALNLAFHGARAQDKEFNVTLERDLGKGGAPIEVVPQDITRVFLNLFGNGFYAASKRRAAARGAGFRPTLKVSSRDLGDAVEVKVRDNGIGIAPEVRDKLFQPFFTTKPTGEGTGLGLSISYDIVTQQHGGAIEVESKVGEFTEFTVRLPRRRAASSKGA